jgi:hypothetical protein
MAKNGTQPKARSVRFSPDPGTLAEIQFEKQGVLFGLVLNESSGGCAVVLMTDQDIPVHSRCRCKVGQLAWTDAEVRWTKVLDKNLVKLGLQYHLE